MSERFAGRYALLRPLGSGGMGEVFLARDLTAGTICALKRLTRRAPTAARDALAREFELIARVRHPAVVEVHELGFDRDGTPFYTMEYVPGRPAGDAIGRGDWATLGLVAARVASALEAMHASGVVHQDVKPSNVLVMPGPEPASPPAGVRVLDFGLAALLADERKGHRGTIGYAAPEVVRGEAATAASDLYGLGATLYALIVARPPFEGDTPAAVLRHQQAGPPPALPLEEAGAPAGLVPLVLRLLAPEPGERPRDARAVRRELEAILPAARWPLAERLNAASLVGRERELARLEVPASGRRRIVAVTGDAGFGKSLLLETAALRATLAGAWVARLSCASLAGSGTAARALLLRLAADAPETGGGHLAALRSELEAGETAVTATAEALVAAGAEWAGAIQGGGRPLAVLLDDTESLDPLSAAVFRRLALHDRRPISLWVWARRAGGEAPEGDDRALFESGRAEALRLGALGRDEVERLAAARLQSPPPALLVAFLWERAEGHPGLTVELMRAAAAAGALIESESGPALRPDALARVEAPPSFEASLLARVGALPAEARAAAARLAATGRAMDPARAGTAGALEMLARAGLAARDAAGQLRLTPPALARPLLMSLGEDERRALHLEVLEDPSLGAAERFRHRVAAGRPEEAVEEAERSLADTPDARLAAEVAYVAESVEARRAAPWHERAATAEIAAGRFDAAIPHLQRALALDPESPTRGAQWVSLARATFRAGRPREVEAVVQAALAEPRSPADESELLTGETMRLRAVGEHERARESARRAVELAERSGDERVKGTAAMTLASALAGLKEYEEAEKAAASAHAFFRRAADPVGIIRSTIARGTIALARLKWADAEALLREAVEASRREDARLAIDEALNALAVLLMQTGRWKEARTADAESLRLALEDARPRNAALTLTNLAVNDALSGAPHSALRHARAGLRMTRRYWPEREATAWRVLATAHRVSGRFDAAIRAARRAIALSEDGRQPVEAEWAALELGRARMRQGRWAEARSVLDGISGGPGSSLARTVAVALAGRAALRMGDPDAARARLERAEAWLAENSAPWAAALAAQLGAEIEIVAGQTPEALARAERVLEGFAALPAPPDRAEAALGFARLAMDRGGAAGLPVGDWLEQAAGLFERLGDHRGREQALAMLVRWQRRAQFRTPAEGRERDLIGAVSRLLHSMPDLHVLAQRAMKIAVEQLGAQRGVLLLADPATGRLNPIAEEGALDAGARRDAVGYSRQVVARVTERGGAVVIGDAPSDPGSMSESMVDMRLRSIVCVPLFLGGRVIGAVYMDDARRADVFSDHDRALLEGFAQLMAVAIENSRGHEEVRRANEALVGENLSLRQEVGARYQIHNVIGGSAPMQRVLGQIQQIAQFDTTVLLTGENGTGKDLLARILHHSSRRRLRKFVAVDCAALPESLLESELFGVMRNVATGVAARDGRFLQADGGTLFLNEIGEMPLPQQVALLNALSSREITPIGGTRPIPVDVRVIAATNRDLAKLVDQGRFRTDLYYRLNVVQIEAPPLRERKADIPALAHHFAASLAAKHGRPIPEMSHEFLAALMQSDWPGNVRELENYIERMVTLTAGTVLRPDPPPPDLERRRGGSPPRGRKLPEVIDRIERRMVREALQRAEGNQSLAARELGLTEQSFRYRLRKYGLPGRKNRRPRRFSR